MHLKASKTGARDSAQGETSPSYWLGSPDMRPVSVWARLRARSAVLLLSASLDVVLPRSGMAQDASGSGAAQDPYEVDVSCAAAAEAWMIGMPNGTPVQEQNKAWAVSALFARRAQASGHDQSRSPAQIVAAIEAFEAEALPNLKSSDPATAAKMTAEAATATQKCAALPEAESLPKNKGNP